MIARETPAGTATLETHPRPIEWRRRAGQRHGFCPGAEWRTVRGEADALFVDSVGGHRPKPVSQLLRERYRKPPFPDPGRWVDSLMLCATL